MKGVVFTELLEMAEARFSLRVLDRVITAANPASRGHYTSVGTYPHDELVSILIELSKETGIGPDQLLRDFGEYLFARLAVGHPGFFAEVKDAFALLKTVEDYIHVEVRKLYPEAELPSIDCRDDGPDRLILVYRSPRRLADLAEGLITGCGKHFGEALSLKREDLSGGKGDVVRFTLSRHADS